MSVSTQSRPTTRIQQPTFHAGEGHFLNKVGDQSKFTDPIMQTEHPRWSTLDQAERLLSRDGYVVIPGQFTADECARMRERAITEGRPDSQLGFDLNKRPDWLWVIDKDPGIELLDRLLGSDCKLMGAATWTTCPGRKLVVHVDHQCTVLPDGIDLPPEAPQACYLAVLIAALEDQDPGMGPTMVVPGSHRRRPRPGDPPVSPVGLVMRQGEAVIIRGDLLHGGSLNTGPRNRYHFHSTWVQSYIDMGQPPIRYEKYWASEVLAAVTPRQRRILGGWPHPNGGREGIWKKELDLGEGGGGSAYAH